MDKWLPKVPQSTLASVIGFADMHPSPPHGDHCSKDKYGFTNPAITSSVTISFAPPMGSLGAQVFQIQNKHQ